MPKNYFIELMQDLRASGQFKFRFVELKLFKGLNPDGSRKFSANCPGFLCLITKP